MNNSHRILNTIYQFLQSEMWSYITYDDECDMYEARADSFGSGDEIVGTGKTIELAIEDYFKKMRLERDNRNKQN